MRPLVSPVREYRALGIADALGGLALAVVAVDVEGLAIVALNLTVFVVVYGTLVYYLTTLRYAARAIGRPGAPTTSARESATRTRMRIAAVGAAQLVVLALIAVLLGTLSWMEDPPAWSLMAGVLTGQGVVFLLASRRWRNWERDHHSSLFREPRWYWSRVGRGGWGIDPRDFYVVDAAQSP